MSKDTADNKPLGNLNAGYFEPMDDDLRLAQIEIELSRLRSVLYLLVKDKPDMLRLLGQTPPASEESRP